MPRDPVRMRDWRVSFSIMSQGGDWALILYRHDSDNFHIKPSRDEKQTRATSVSAHMEHGIVQRNVWQPNTLRINTSAQNNATACRNLIVHVNTVWQNTLEMTRELGQILNYLFSHCRIFQATGALTTRRRTAAMTSWWLASTGSGLASGQGPPSVPVSMPPLGAVPRSWSVAVCSGPLGSRWITSRSSSSRPGETH